MTDSKWDKVNKYLKKDDQTERENEVNLEEDYTKGIVPSNTKIIPQQDGVGFFEKLDLSKLAHKANVEKAKQIMDAQLANLREAVASAQTLKSQQIEAHFKKVQKEMEIEYNKMLDELGLRHKDDKSNTLKHLLQQTSDQLLIASELDVQPELKEEYLQDLFNMHQDLRKEILKELGEDVKEMGEKRKNI